MIPITQNPSHCANDTRSILCASFSGSRHSVTRLAASPITKGKKCNDVTSNRTTSKQASTTICVVLKATAGDVALGQGLLHDDDQNCGDSGMTDE